MRRCSPPKLRMVYFSEKVEDYTIRNSAGDTLWH